MADTRSFEERQRELSGVEKAARMVGIEEIEAQRRRESALHEQIDLLRGVVAAVREVPLWGLPHVHGVYALRAALDKLDGVSGTPPPQTP
jgi:hypothetical protein